MTALHVSSLARRIFFQPRLLAHLTKPLKMADRDPFWGHGLEDGDQRRRRRIHFKTTRSSNLR